MKHALLLLIIFGNLSYSAMASNELLHRDKLTRRDSATLELVQLWGYAQGAHDVLLQSPSPMLVNNMAVADSICFDRAIQFIRHYGYPTPTLLGKYACLKQTGVLIPILLRNRTRLAAPEIRELLQNEVMSEKVCKILLVLALMLGVPQA